MFDWIFAALAAEAGPPSRVMLDATHLKAHCTATSLLKKGLFPASSAAPGGLNAKLHAVCNRQGRPVALLLTEGQVSDHRGAALMLPKLPPANELIADRGHDSVRFRAEPAARGIAACIPSTRSRKQPIPHDAAPYRQRHRIENMFGRLKDWLRIAMRYDRCAETFLAAITLAATVTISLNQ